MKNEICKARMGLLATILCIAGGVTFTSCDSDTLSPRLARKALEKEAMFRDSSAVATLRTGFYEASEAELDQLAKLQAAGMVTFTPTVVVEKVSKRSYDYWRGYSYYTVNEEHTFAEVSLTPEGMKYKVWQPVTARKDQEKDMKLNETASPTLPEYMLATYTPPAEKTIPAKPEQPVVEETAVVSEESTAIPESEPAEAAAEPAPAPDPYEAACARTWSESHNMLTGRYSIAKVKEVFCPEEWSKNGLGKCRYIYEFTGKTPFGFVLGAPDEGRMFAGEATLRHYTDSGWLVSENAD